MRGVLNYGYILLVDMRYFIFIFLIFISCNKDDSHFVPEIKVDLEPKFELEFQDHPLFSWSLQAKVVDGEEFLFIGDIKSFDRIFVYNMGKNEWSNSLLFEKEGPDGIGRLNGFYVHNLDSIFTVESFAWKIHLIGKEGKLNFYDTRKGLGSQEVITPFNTSNAISGLINDKLIFYGFPELPYNYTEYHNKAKTGQALNIANEESLIGGGYPDLYFDELWPGPNVISNRQAVAFDRILHSFSFSDEVLVFDENYVLKEKLSIPSNKKKPTKKFTGRAFSDIHEEPAYYELISAGYYSDIYFDANHNRIYRTLSYSDYDPKDFLSFAEYKETVKRNLIIFDYEKKELIGELDLTDYDIDAVPMAFVGKEGLYLSKTHIDKEIVTFYLLTL